MSYEFWNRDSLYEEVWATPMAKLAKQYGISDVGLAKVCRKLAIPVPGRGYWAKKEAGQVGHMDHIGTAQLSGATAHRVARLLRAAHAPGGGRRPLTNFKVRASISSLS